MAELVDVNHAARALGVAPSRVRALIADGGLEAEKLGGRWLVRWDSVALRRRGPVGPGRPMSPRNAWALVLAASGESVPSDIDQHTRWRLERSLDQHRLVDLRARLDQRASVGRRWALPGELRRLREDDAVVLTGSSAAGELGLALAVPDTVDVYVPVERLEPLVVEYGLEHSPVAQANVVVRAVPEGAWFLDGRRVAPAAAVGLDLAGYPDSRSSRVGAELLARLDESPQGH
jgi:hypothetical protein